mmetsp:Transcript_34949/g.71458  ORF Transcript_34949/g.71458 Transcript_34949/m.71458 type:complete len:223 (-) Transcript_34949:47-715(-)
MGTSLCEVQGQSLRSSSAAYLSVIFITSLVPLEIPLGPSCDTHQVNAIPIALPVRKVVTKVSPVHAHGLPPRQDSHIVPIHLHVPERWPPVLSALRNEFVVRASTRGDEQLLPRVGVVEGDLPAAGLHVRRFPEKGRRKEVLAVLGVMPVVVADSVCKRIVAFPSEVRLDRRFRRSVRLGFHDGLFSHDNGWTERLPASHCPSGQELRDFISQPHTTSLGSS